MTSFAVHTLSAFLIVTGPFAHAEVCSDQYLQTIKSSFEAAGGLLARNESFPLAVIAYPANSRIQSIQETAWSKLGCRVPSLDFYLEGDEVDPGSMHGITSVVRGVFHEIADYDDLASQSIEKMVNTCLKGRPVKYDHSYRRTGSRSSNKSIELMGCFTEAVPSGGSQTYLRFMPIKY